MHEYRLTEYSLYAAVSVGLKSKEIIETLEKFSKTFLHEDVKKYIARTTDSFGKVKLVLRRNNYYLESRDPKILLELLKFDVIKRNRVDHHNSNEVDPETGFVIFKSNQITLGIGATNSENYSNESLQRYQDDDDDMADSEMHAFQIQNENNALRDVSISFF